MSPMEIGQQLATAQTGSVRWLRLIDKYMALEPSERDIVTKEFFMFKSLTTLQQSARRAA